MVLPVESETIGLLTPASITHAQPSLGIEQGRKQGSISLLNFFYSDSIDLSLNSQQSTSKTQPERIRAPILHSRAG
jgi:hypothetical protein